MFYKKKYKKIKKKLNIIIDNSVLYVSDNLGYFYSYDYKEDRVLWAKNFKIPFRSNLKIFDNYNFNTEILSASIRSPMHIIDCAKIGSDVVTAPLKSIKSLLNHPLTDIGLKKFIDDYNKGNK